MADGRTMGLTWWLVVFVLVNGFRSGSGDLTVTMQKTVMGYKGESVVIPCAYATSNNEEVVKIEWEFRNAPVIFRDGSEDHIKLTHYRKRASISKSPAGDVSLTLQKLDMDDRGNFKCKVTGRDGGGRLIAREFVTELKVGRTRPPTEKPEVTTEGVEMTTDISVSSTVERDKEIIPTNNAHTVTEKIVTKTPDMETATTARWDVNTKIHLTTKPDVKVSSSGGEADKTTDISVSSTVERDKEIIPTNNTHTVTGTSNTKDDSAIVSTKQPRRFHSSTISVLPLTTNVVHENPAAEAIKSSGIFFYVLIIGLLCLMFVVILAMVLMFRRKKRKSFTYSLPSMNQLALNLEERPCGGGGCQSFAGPASNDYEPCFPVSQYESLPISSEYEQLILKNAEENDVHCETSESCAQSVQPPSLSDFEKKKKKN